MPLNKTIFVSALLLLCSVFCRAENPRHYIAEAYSSVLKIQHNTDEADRLHHDLADHSTNFASPAPQNKVSYYRKRKFIGSRGSYTISSPARVSDDTDHEFRIESHSFYQVNYDCLLKPFYYTFLFRLTLF